MNTKKSEDSEAATEIDRRQHPRVRLTAEIMARHVGRGETYVIDEAGAGGFSITSTTAFEPDSQHHFRLSNASGQAAIIATVCRHCTRIEREGQGPAYRTGFQFLSQPTRRLRIILGAIAADAP